MSNVALEFDGVWKKFKKGEIHDSLRDLIPALTNRLFSRDRRSELQDREFWALQDINFQVRAGEAFGIIGANGAGKSTTLKLLSRILRPNCGRIRAHGRMSALIEVGAGFHPDLTGRENVYLNGAILGMSRQEIARKFDEIVEFAGIGDFIDTPVKRYSSGMYARLGFGVAAHVDPEILLVDEVLSVGDMQFQGKCLQRMRRVVSEGTTVIFVSHNLQAVEMLCSRALLLARGRVAELGQTRNVLLRYVQTIQGGNDASIQAGPIGNVRLEDQNGRMAESFTPGDPAFLKFTIAGSVPVDECILAFIVYRITDGQALCDYNLRLVDVQDSTCRGHQRHYALRFDVNLLRGSYGIYFNLWHCPSSSFLIRQMNAGLFAVNETVSYGGVAHLIPVLQASESATVPEPVPAVLPGARG
jgi:ABC-type polysaccharide/polyol phosphate transport system ATPase subunit